MKCKLLIFAVIVLFTGVMGAQPPTKRRRTTSPSSSNALAAGSALVASIGSSSSSQQEQDKMPELAGLSSALAGSAGSLVPAQKQSETEDCFSSGITPLELALLKLDLPNDGRQTDNNVYDKIIMSSKNLSEDEFEKLLQQALVEEENDLGTDC